MAQPHKGPRRQTNMRLPAPVYTDIKAQADTAGLYTNEYTADLLSIITGHPDLVAKLPDVRAAAADIIAVLQPIAADPSHAPQLDLMLLESPVQASA